MSEIFRTLLPIHALAGAVALATFWAAVPGTEIAADRHGDYAGPATTVGWILVDVESGAGPEKYLPRLEVRDAFRIVFGALELRALLREPSSRVGWLIRNWLRSSALSAKLARA